MTITRFGNTSGCGFTCSGQKWHHLSNESSLEWQWPVCILHEHRHTLLKLNHVRFFTIAQKQLNWSTDAIYATLEVKPRQTLCIHSKPPHVVTVLWRDSDDVVTILSSTRNLVEGYKTMYLCHLDSYTVTVCNGYLVSSHAVTVSCLLGA